MSLQFAELRNHGSGIGQEPLDKFCEMMTKKTIGYCVAILLLEYQIDWTRFKKFYCYHSHNRPQEQLLMMER